jgi:hypothetical protein
MALSQPIQPGNEEIEITFTYRIPDEWRGNTFDKGITGTWKYHGPRWLAFQIDINTGRENGWCLLSDREHERPLALDSVRILLDATASDENALIAEICNDTGNRAEVDFRTLRQWKETHKAPEGYESIWEPLEVCPRDIYDEFNITYDFDTHCFNIPLKDLELEGWNPDITWDDIRALRTRMLQNCDNKLAPDMPEAAQAPWRAYRQLLRDLPTALAAFPAPVAAHMFPREPADTPMGSIARSRIQAPGDLKPSTPGIPGGPTGPNIMYTGGTHFTGA